MKGILDENGKSLEMKTSELIHKEIRTVANLELVIEVSTYKWWVANKLLDPIKSERRQAKLKAFEMIG